MLNRVQLRILGLIEANSGRFSWYQLDRGLSECGVDHAGQLLRLLEGLLAEGLIEASSGTNPAQPVYAITDAGVAAMGEARRREE